METEARRLAGALRQSQIDLAKVVSQLPSKQLEQPSYCSDWDMAQVLSHLGSGAELSLSSLERVLVGKPPVPREEFPHVWARWDSLSREAKAAEMVVWDRRCASVFWALDDSVLSSLQVELFGMQLDAATWLGLRVNEHALHTWDIAVALDTKAELPARSVDLLVDRIAFLAGRLGRANEAAGHRHIEVRTTGPERRFLMAVEDTVSFGSVEPSANVDGVLELPAAALLRLVYGRLDPEHTPADVKTEGSADLTELRRVFPGF